MTNKNGTPIVLAFGELLWDVLPSGAVLGGAPANFALRLHNLGIDVRLVSRVGNDHNGNEALSILKQHRLSTDLVQIDPKAPTGTVDVTIDSKGDASYVINPKVAYENVETTKELLDVAQKATVICYGTLVQRGLKTRESLYEILEKATQAIKIVDINLRKDCFEETTVKRSLEFADVLKLNEDEVWVVNTLLKLNANNIDEFCKKIIENFDLKVCIVTRAGNGVIAVNNKGERCELAGFRVNVADTVGSGDAFTAGFISMYVKGSSLNDCCEFGNRLGATVATKKGGMALVTESEIAAIG